MSSKIAKDASANKTTKKTPAKRGRKAKVTTTADESKESTKSELKVYSSTATTKKKRQTKKQTQQAEQETSTDVVILRLKIDVKNLKSNHNGPLPYSSMGYEYEHFTENMSKAPSEISEDFYKKQSITDPMTTASINIVQELNMIENTAMNRVVDSMVEYTEAKKHKKWPKQVNIACYWCTEFFESIPVGIPVKVETKKTGTGKKQKTKNYYHCEDNYCTFECACADLFDKKRGNFRERYSLLCSLYKEANNLPKMRKIKSALPRKALAKYGGPHSIDKFRELSKVSCLKYIVVDPPMVPVLSQLESNYMDFSPATRSNSYIPINRQMSTNRTAMSSMHRPKSQFTATGIHNDNTLLKFMKEPQKC